MLREKELNVKPNNHLVWAVITTLFCCLPLGIVGIVHAVGVDDAWHRGDKELAYEKAYKAQSWSKWAAIIGGIGITLYVVLCIAYGVTLYNILG